MTDGHRTAELSPLGTEAEFAALIEQMVTASAPRLFAVVQEYGDRLDGRVAASGLAFDDHVDVLDVDGCGRLRLRSLHRAVSAYAQNPDVSTRTLWWGHERENCWDHGGALC